VVSADLLANADIYLMNDDGSDRIRLTDTLGLDIDPSWSPDGSQIAFRSTRDGQDEIYIMSADGSCQRDLTNSPADDRSPAWSPDGARIAFDHFFDDGYQDIAAINVDGSGLRRLTDAQGEYPAWSPDGSEIAFASVRDGDYDIYVMNADGTDQRAITHNSTYDMYPAWSPDGRQIVYECEATPSAGFLGAAADICLMQRTGDQIRNITADAASNRFPAWSAAGMLAWSRGGSIQVASPVDGHPLDIGPGTFPDWRP
jgi:Tol biopolymer transport system component